MRFTAYLGDGERQGLRDLAAREGCSENYLVRIAVRRLLNLPAPFPQLRLPGVPAVRDPDPR